MAGTVEIAAYGALALSLLNSIALLLQGFRRGRLHADIQTARLRPLPGGRYAYQLDLNLETEARALTLHQLLLAHDQAAADRPRRKGGKPLRLVLRRALPWTGEDLLTAGEEALIERMQADDGVELEGLRLRPGELRHFSLLGLLSTDRLDWHQPTGAGWSLVLEHGGGTTQIPFAFACHPQFEELTRPAGTDRFGLPLGFSAQRD